MLANYAIFTLLAISFDVVFALLLGSPISAGGLSLPPRTIGTIFSVGSIVSGLFQALFFTRMHRLWGLRNIYMVTMIAYLPIYTAMPIMAAVAKFSGQVNPLIWTILGLVRAACVLTPGAFSEWIDISCLRVIHLRTFSLHVYLHHESFPSPVRFRSNPRSSPDNILTHGCYWAR